MLAPIQTARMTAKQFLQLGEDPPGIRLELVNGEIELAPSPIPDHSHVDRILTIVVGNYILERDLGKIFGDVDTLLGEFDVRRPDIIYFRKDRLHLVGRQAIEGPPDLCVEIISPSSVQIDREVKFQQYQQAGVANYWLIDPAKRTFEAFALDGGKYRQMAGGEGEQQVSAPPFEELVIPLAMLWQ